MMGEGDDHIEWWSGQCEWSDSKKCQRQVCIAIKDKNNNNNNKGTKAISLHSESRESIDPCP